MQRTPVTLADVLDVLRRYVAEQVPGHSPRTLRIVLEDGSRIEHPVPPAAVRQLELQPETAPTPKPARHSPDFRSVHWYGANYTFTAAQAAVVRILWSAWVNGTPDIGGEALLEGAGLEDSARLSNLFTGCDAWQTMIVAGESRGSYRLQPPE